MKKLFASSMTILVIAISLYVGYSLTVDNSDDVASNDGTKTETSTLDTRTEKKAKESNPNKAADNEAKKTLTIYYQNGDFLKAEERTGVEPTPKDAIKELLKGPSEQGNQYFIPKTVRLLSFDIEKGKAIVNFSKEILDRTKGGATEEELTIYSITNTLTEFDDVKSVEIQIEGKSAGEVDGRPVQDFWGHVGLYDQPFERNEALIK